jgi:RNA polymerase sigma-70 factor (sigma-E family)
VALEEELSQFVSARYVHLRRTAYLLCGDWHRAEDLVQTALARVVVAARRRQVDNLDAYTRRSLLRVFLTDSRIAWRRRERSWADPGDGPSTGDDRTTALAVLAALGGLPPRQRAVVVLRFWEDRSVEETAEALKVSEGTVKSQAAKALAKLRHTLADVHVELIPARRKSAD